MLIGIDGSRAFIKNRTGIEEYSYQTIKHLTKVLGENQACSSKKRVILYLRKNQEIDFELPKNWSVKKIGWPRLWTQGGLSLEMLLYPVDVLFVPAHTVPLVHPKKTVVTIHGLEYEFCKEAFSWWDRFYMRLSIKNSCCWAKNIVSVSENTKKDLMNLYEVSEEKVKVIYEGYARQGRNFQFPISNFQSNQNDKFSKNETLKIYSKFKIQNSKFLLYIGRIEERKNITNIIKAFEILKEKQQISHKLVLAGKSGHGYENIKKQISNFKFKDEVLELGFVTEEEKWELLQNAACFVFPTKYEGFGIPVLEAQSVGCPVVASNNSSIPEVAGESAILVDCAKATEIADGIWRLISDENLKNDLKQKGLKNIERFSWEKCAEEIAKILIK